MRRGYGLGVRGADPGRRWSAAVLVVLACSASPRPAEAQGTALRSVEVCDTIGIPEALYERVVLREFSRLVGQKAGPVVGSYASVKVKDARASIAGALVRRDGSILGVEATGGVSEGVVGIVSGSKLSGSVGARVEYHLLNRRNTTLRYRRDTCITYQERRAAARERYVADSVAARLDFPETLRRREVERLDVKLRTLKRAIDSLAAHPTARDPTGTKRDSLRADSTLTQLRPDDRAAARTRSLSTQLTLLNYAYAESLHRLADSVKTTGFSLGWTSIGYEVDNTTFRLFDPGRPAADQIEKTSYATQSLVVHYQRYNLSSVAGETTYWRVGARFGLEHNLGSLIKIEVTQRTPLATTEGDRFSEEKFTVFQGDYKKDLSFARLEADYYRFAFSQTGAAIHFFPSAEFVEGRKMALNLGVGLLVNALSTEKAASRVNAELFVELADLSNNRDADENLLERSSLGLRISFPFNFYRGS